MRATIRNADPLALVTEVTNTGANTAQILEAGIVVGVVAGGDTIKLPERGRLLLEAMIDSGNAYLSVKTHQRGPCGDIVIMTAPDNEPIGSFLL